MNVRTYIERTLRNKKEIRTSDIVKACGVSRQFANRTLQELLHEGKLARIGNSNRARYVVLEKQIIDSAKLKESVFNRNFINYHLEEDRVLGQIHQQTGILLSLPENILKIVEYAFTEMLNNAIEHSQSKDILVKVKRLDDGIKFTVLDRGIGIFHNIMIRNKLENELAAIQDILKGKQTTMPDTHSGEGIFFTSKLADRFSIKSFKKTLLFDNTMNDVFLTDTTTLKGTRIDFLISLASTKSISEVFSRYAGDQFEFSTTEVVVDLYKASTTFVSRSQARRILTGLGNFQKIILDFKNTESIGQAFADEIFRVWKSYNLEKEIIIRNAGENIQIMIDHATHSNR
ncbi:MAG: DUF4325 domain-containing protein [Bacteroidota bacterium]|nr:DUF4325 domain-containing protein [Bacteroidota bacterium]